MTSVVSRKMSWSSRFDLAEPLHGTEPDTFIRQGDETGQNKPCNSQ